MKAIEQNTDVMGGAKVFPGTRVPVQTLFDYLKNGDSIDVFLEDFPTVKRERVIAFLDAVKDSLTEVA